MLVIFAATFISLIIIQYTASQMIFLNSFAAHEEEETNENMERIRSALFDGLSYLDSYVYDWAAWDDTYAFIQDLNEDYIESNLVDETFIGAELNIIVYVNTNGEIVFGKAFDLKMKTNFLYPKAY
jgi:sensor domain CHASE-containing protein